MPEECVSFEAWVEWVFTRAHKEFHGELPDRSELERIPRATRAEYFARLLENSDQYADKYNEDQIADAVWHLFGVDGSYWGNLDCPHYYGSMPNDDAMNALARRCLLAVPKIYRDLFARVCDDWGRSRHIDLSDTRRVDVAVYMIWDMDQLQYFAMSTPDRKILAWKVLAEILEIDSYTCRKSALHGLGHLACNHNSESRTIVNDFLRSHPNLPTSLRSYAECARDGAVMQLASVPARMRTRKQPVLAMVEKGGEVRTCVIADVTGHTLRKAMPENVEQSALITTNEQAGYNGTSKHFAKHKTVKHGVKEYVKSDGTTTTVEWFYSRAKRYLNGTWHAVSKEHLHRYMEHAAYLYNTREMNDGDRTLNLIRRADRKRLTYW